MTTDTAPEKAGDESTADSENADAGKTITETEAKKIAERAVKSRLERERKKFAKELDAARSEAVDQWRADNGIDDGVIEKLGEGQTVDVQLKKENRNLKTDATKAKNALDSLQAQYNALLASHKNALVNDALLREAAGKFVDPQDAVDKLSSRFKYDEDAHEVFIVDDKGEPSGLSVPELVSGLLESKPHLAVPEGLPGAGSRVSVPAQGSDTPKGKLTDAQRKAMLKGLLDD